VTLYKQTVERYGIFRSEFLNFFFASFLALEALISIIFRIVFNAIKVKGPV
jgi:hypothetical protein